MIAMPITTAIPSLVFRKLKLAVKLQGAYWILLIYTIINSLTLAFFPDWRNLIFNCFGHVLDTQEEISDPRVFMQRLNEQGYKPTDHPGLGDIVLYTKHEGDLPLHAGILIGESTAESKFGKGYIYRHPLNAEYISSEYGNNIRFLTKRSEPSPK